MDLTTFYAVVSATCETLVPGVRPERREERRLAEIEQGMRVRRGTR